MMSDHEFDCNEIIVIDEIIYEYYIKLQIHRVGPTSNFLTVVINDNPNYNHFIAVV